MQADVIALQMARAPVLPKLELTEYNPEFSAIPEKQYKDLTDQIFINQFLAILCTVAFTIIAVGALAAASFFAPIAIPFVLLGASAAIPVFKQYVYDHFRDLEQKYTHEAELQKESLELFEQFNSEGNSRLNHHYRTNLPRDITLSISLDGKTPSEKAMLPVVAKYQAHLDKIVKLKASFEEAIAKLNASFRDKLKECNPKDHAKQHQIALNNAQAVAYEHRILEQQILVCKVKAAWYLHLLRHPKAQGTFETSAYLYQLDPATRLLNAQSKDQSVLPAHLLDPYLGLADGTVLSKRTVIKLSVNDLSYAFSRGGKAVQAAWDGSHPTRRPSHSRDNSSEISTQDRNSPSPSIHESDLTTTVASQKKNSLSDRVVIFDPDADNPLRVTSPNSILVAPHQRQEASTFSGLGSLELTTTVSAKVDLLPDHDN